MTTNPAAAITKAASKQTYYTIRFLVDRERVDDAYRAYAYFRWVDDTLDAGSISASERLAFIERQKDLLDKCYRGKPIPDANPQEQMLIELVRPDHAENSGLQIYLRNMMQVMDFDARRRGRLISQVELYEYTYWLASAVTEAMHYFIGHCDPSPRGSARYLAATGAHIAHMLRDTLEDTASGYYNIPREVLEYHSMAATDVESDAYRAWVFDRVQLARENFKAGRNYLSQVRSLRCRLAGLAYMARFEGGLQRLQREGYLITAKEPEPLRLTAGLKIILPMLKLSWRHAHLQPESVTASADGSR